VRKVFDNIKNFGVTMLHMKSQVVGSKSSIKRAQSYHLAFMPLASVIELLTDEFQVTGDIEQVLGIRMKFFEYALLTYPQFQIYIKACQKKTKANKNTAVAAKA